MQYFLTAVANLNFVFQFNLAKCFVWLDVDTFVVLVINICE